MSKLVAPTCEVVIYKGTTCVNPVKHLFPPESLCGQPGFDFVDFGDLRVWMCLEHWSSHQCGMQIIDELKSME
jgi:hypothetical protein